jgi:hypothetical protein
MSDFENYPVWIELVSNFKTKKQITLTPFNWVVYVRYFEKDELALFLELGIDVHKFIKDVISHLLEPNFMTGSFIVHTDEGHYYQPTESIEKMKSPEYTTVKLQELAEIWQYNYASIDCIQLCLDINNGPSICALKYFLENGLSFQLSHIKNNLSTEIITLMVQNGLDIQEIALAHVEKFRDEKKSYYQTFCEFAKCGVDLTELFLQTQKVSN